LLKEETKTIAKELKTDYEKRSKEEKKGVSIFGIALGVVLLVGTAGAYNYFSKNK
jgi:hypothetical protein